MYTLDGAHLIFNHLRALSIYACISVVVAHIFGKEEGNNNVINSVESILLMTLKNTKNWIAF